MDNGIPSAQEVRDRLLRLDLAEVRKLAATSGVPFTTLWKVRAGETANPGLDTVRKFWPDLADADENPAPALAPQAQAAINGVAFGEGA